MNESKNTGSTNEQAQSYKVEILTDKSAAPAGFRLSQILFRYTEANKKKGEKKRDNLCVSVPCLPDLKAGDPLTELMAKALNNCLLDWQDELIRTLAVDGGATEIHESKITLDAILTHATTESQRKRMTKEAIGAWFDIALAEKLATAILKKAPHTKSEQVASTIESYRELYCSLAAVKPAVTKQNAERLLKQIARAPEDGMRKELERKLDLILNPPQVEIPDIGMDD